MSTKLYIFDLQTGVYLGSRPAQTRPNGAPITDCLDATPVAPPEMEAGFVARWNGSTWELKEDHRGEAGWLAGQPHTITDLGPLPDGFSVTPPEPTPEETAAERAAAIRGRLQEIDAASIRPLRAKLAGTATAEDEARYTELEREAAELRAELAGLESPVAD